MLNQAQDSLTEQMVRVITLATLHGEYDAADWINKAFWSRGPVYGPGDECDPLD